MKILIHAVPIRMWYVEGFLIPELERQGIEDIDVWCVTEGKGNLRACMESFAARLGDGGTWNLQDDVLLCRDFIERCRENDGGVDYGFCNEAFLDDPEAGGCVNVSAAWHSF